MAVPGFRFVGSIVRRAAELLVLVLAPIAFYASVLTKEDGSKGGVAYDFREAFLPAAHAVAHGTSPFGPATVAALRPGTAFVYPPVAAFAFVPFTWVPAPVATYALSLLVLACVPATLWILGVRDWRCYGAALLWSPVGSSIRLGALSPPLALLAAVAWRYRHRVAGVATALASAVAVKLFLWPLVVWLVAARRWRSAVVGATIVVGLLLIPWAALGFAGLGEYPHLLRILSSIEAPESYTLAAVVHKAGFAWRAGEAVSYVAGFVLLAVGYRAGRHGRDLTSFVLVVAAALVLSPIVWIHYFALLLVPVALMSPTFGLAWLLPIALWLFPITPGVASWPKILAALALAAATVVLSARTWRRVPVAPQELVPA